MPPPRITTLTLQLFKDKPTRHLSQSVPASNRLTIHRAMQVAVRHELMPIIIIIIIECPQDERGATAEQDDNDITRLCTQRTQPVSTLAGDEERSSIECDI